MDGRRQHVAFHGIEQARLRQRGGAVGAHAAGVRSCIAVKRRLVILRRRQRHDGPARHQGQDAQLLALQPLLDDHFSAGVAAELLADHDAVDGGQGFFLRGADDDALAGGQAVGLDHHGILAGLDVVAGRVGVIEDLEFASGDVGVAHEHLGECLAGLQLGAACVGPKTRKPGFLESIDDAAGQRLLGADDGQTDRFLLGEADEAVEVVGVEAAR